MVLSVSYQAENKADDQIKAIMSRYASPDAIEDSDIPLLLDLLEALPESAQIIQFAKKLTGAQRDKTIRATVITCIKKMQNRSVQNHTEIRINDEKSVDMDSPSLDPLTIRRSLQNVLRN